MDFTDFVTVHMMVHIGLENALHPMCAAVHLLYTVCMCYCVFHGTFHYILFLIYIMPLHEDRRVFVCMVRPISPCSSPSAAQCSWVGCHV